MPRKTDTFNRVHDAADALLAEGIRPTQQSVRERLGTGSISTINRALNEWWAQLASRMQQQQARPDLPEPVTDAANRMWQQALAYAEHALQGRMQEIERHYAEKYAGAEQSAQLIQDLRNQNAGLIDDRESYSAESHALRKQVSSLEGEVIRLTAQHDSLRRENKQQALILERSNRAGSSADTEVLIELKVSLRLSQETCRQQKDSLDRLTAENDSLKSKLREVERQAVAKQHALETVIAQQDVRYDQLVKELDTYKDSK